MPSGYSASFLTNLALDGGLLYTASSDIASLPANPWAASIGGFSFNPGEEWRQPQFDGMRSPIKALDRIIGWKPQIKGKFKAFAASQVNVALPGNTNATSGTGAVGTKYTSKAAGVFLASGDYMANLRLVFNRPASGKIITILFPTALVVDWSITGQDKDEVTFDATFEARLDMSVATNTDVCPYFVEEII